jgi:hypothetical protein
MLMGNQVAERLRASGIEVTEEVYRVVESELEKHNLRCRLTLLKINGIFMPAIVSEYSSEEIKKIEELIYQETLKKINQETKH